MLRISLDSLESGMVLGEGIHTEDGRLLLGRGVVLDNHYISRLKKLGFLSVYIKDENTEDILPAESIPEMVRGATLSHLRKLFETFEDLGREVKGSSIKAIHDAVTSDQFQNTFRNHPAFQRIIGDANQIVEALLAGEVMIGLNSLKSYDNYTFMHSIDVTIVSIMIGRRIGLPPKRLRELGIGCLLHDIGKTFIPREILNKPDKLTAEEFERMKTHPQIGFEIVRGVETIGILPPHVVFQHHERQDGSGYPRGLIGDNRLDISDEPRTIHLYGSIAAVADVFDALSSDRPYRKALPPEEVINLLSSMAKTDLNREVLRNLLAVTPVYPVASTVRITKGKYLNHIGVVSRLNRERLDRPVVRLVFDGTRRRITPVDVDLLQSEDTDIVSILL
jgi:HD-GYP domain-containing protein (c-di-GMP phosphodiesterase class II)